jgi:hypothetical protein
LKIPVPNPNNETIIVPAHEGQEVSKPVEPPIIEIIPNLLVFCRLPWLLKLNLRKISSRFNPTRIGIKAQSINPRGVINKPKCSVRYNVITG